MSTPAVHPGLGQRFAVYQRERFPLAKYVPTLAVVALSTLGFARLLRGEATFPQADSALVAGVVALIFFLQLRIADEFKDFDADTRFRPYRAVPRGVVSLRELAVVAAAGAVVQLILSAWLEPRLLSYLFGIWLYMALMTKEFFVGEWLQRHPLLYGASHMVVMPAIVLFVAACDLAVADAGIPPGLWWLLGAAYFVGFGLEFGRKIRAPSDEEPGVETYSALWGPRRAVATWLVCLALGAAAGAGGAAAIDFTIPYATAAVLAWLVTCAVGSWFLRRPSHASSELVENASGLVALAVYAMLGLVPLLARTGGAG